MGRLKKDLEMNVLTDMYGALLSDRQRVTLELYYADDLSLSEIGREVGITRQGILNCVNRAGEKLRKYESRLGLVKKYRELIADIDKLEGLIIQSEMTNKKVLSQIDSLLVEIKEKL